MNKESLLSGIGRWWSQQVSMAICGLHVNHAKRSCFCADVEARRRGFSRVIRGSSSCVHSFCLTRASSSLKFYWNWMPWEVSCCLLIAVFKISHNRTKARFPQFHYPSWRPELTARVNGPSWLTARFDGWPVSITRQHGPLHFRGHLLHYSLVLASKRTATIIIISVEGGTFSHCLLVAWLVCLSVC